MAGNSALSTSIYCAQEKSHCRNVSLEDAAIQYKENFTDNLAIDTAVGIGEKFVDVKRTKSIEKNKAMEGEKRKVGKLSTKEKTVRKITSKMKVTVKIRLF